MEFWGVEVKAGQPLKVNPEVGRVIHISQAALGEGKKEKGNHSIPLRLKINNQNFVVGSLSAENFPQVTFDLVFEKEFELSHDWKNGSVYFCGYSADNPYAEDEDEFGDSEDSEDEGIPLGITDNGKVEPKGEEAKPVANKGKSAKPESSADPKGTVMVPKKDESSDESDDDADESDDDEDMMDPSDDIGDSEDKDDSEDEDEDDSEDEDEEPKKAGPSNKRPILSASETPIAAKKAKLETPQKTDGKKGGGHTATPYPSKQQRDGKTPANSNKSKDQTPKSVLGKVTCNSCSKTFNSDSALQSHTKAKHAGK